MYYKLTLYVMKSFIIAAIKLFIKQIGLVKYLSGILFILTDRIDPKYSSLLTNSGPRETNVGYLECGADPSSLPAHNRYRGQQAAYLYCSGACGTGTFR